MALIDALLDKITNPSLRQALQEQVDAMMMKQSFGLVFQQHKPETVELPNYSVRRNCKVRIKTEKHDEFYLVDNVKQGVATIRSLTDEPNFQNVGVDDLVVVRQFGDPIYPGLLSTGKVERGGDRPTHAVINAENFHALEALLYTHEGKIDAIYIDPPYNTRDRDWKYNNDYVDSDDVYRHSKWLAMMERRLKLAGRLLNREDSVLIVTIDSKEYLRLGLLLEQTFPDARMQMVSSVINPAGTGRQNEFSRTNEYIYFLQFGNAVIQPMLPVTDNQVPVEWEPFRRRDLESRRGMPKGGRAQFYPIYVDRKTKRIAGTGEPLAPDADRLTAPSREGCASVFPVREDGTEMNWALTRESFEQRLAKGYARVGRHQPKGQQEYVVSYLRTGPIADIESGRAEVLGRKDDGSVIAVYPVGKQRMPLTQWDFASHDAQRYGTTLLQSLIPNRRFPFPKSLYAVEDVLRIAIGHKPAALVLDFFAGSGTTLHAVARLNRQDNGIRQCICITNNELSEAEAAAMSARGLTPGDQEWEALGICEYITKPRVKAAITGVTPAGEPLVGDYKFVDEFPLSEGFTENVEFFDLTYENPDLVSMGRCFGAIAPLLWLKAGGVAKRIEKLVDGWALPDEAIYGVLFDADRWRAFVNAVTERRGALSHVFVATESEAVFQQIVSELPAGIGATQLYDDYLRTFEINTKERA